MISNNCARFACLAALFALLPATVWAQNNSWIGPSEGNWNNAANWSLGVVPTSAHTVGISSNTVILNSAPAATAGVLNVQLGSELHILNGASLTAVSSNIGIAGNGLLRVAGAGTQSAFLPVGPVASLNLGGPGFTGTLIVENGALVQTGSVLDHGVNLGFAGAGTGHIQLKGTESGRGVLATSRVQKVGSGTLTFDGGVLRALAANPNFLIGFAAGDVAINAGGAFIDTNGLGIGIPAPMSGTGGLTKQGAGTLSLTGANTYAGATTVSTGTLSIGSGGTSGSVAGNILNNAALVFNRSDALSYGGSISGTGTLTKQGAGTTTLTGASTYTGNTTVEAGILRVSGTGSINSPGATLSVGSTSGQPATLEIFAGGDVAALQALITDSATVSGVGSTLMASGLIFVAGDDLGNALTIENGATVSAGGEMRLAVNPAGDGTLNIGAFDLANPTTAGTLQAASVIFGIGSSVGTGVINFNQSDATVFSANISGLGSVVQRGSGTTSLTGAATHTGGTTVSAGTLSIGNGGTAGSIAGNVSLSNVANLAFNRADAHSYAGQASGIGTLTKLGAGTLTLTGANTHSAGTRAKAGVLRVSGTGSIEHFFADMVVGDVAGDQSTLEILAGGSVTNANGALGNAVGSQGSATVSGTDAVWTNLDWLRVGVAGSDNTLTIAAGGSVSSGSGYIGYESTASNNSAVVSSDGLWTNTIDLTVGNAGSFNMLSIQSGGSVSSPSGYIGRASSGNNNSIVVSGENAVWTNPQRLSVGYAGSDNTLAIQNGGRVSSGNSYIGELGSADDNSALVSDGALWTNAAELVVGASGSGNMLTIQGGGVTNTEGYIGLNSDGGANQVLVSGGTSTWTNSEELAVGFLGSGNLLTIEGGGHVSDASAVIGYDGIANGNSVRVSGANSTWANAQSLVVGLSGDDNSLTIESGGRVTSRGISVIGYNSTAGNNRVRVGGPDAVWTHTGTGLNDKILVGLNGSNNSLTIEDGGHVFSDEGVIGETSSASNNSVLITGENSTWTVPSIDVGFRGSNNSLTIANGGRVQSIRGGLAISARFADNNRVLVTGEGSTLLCLADGTVFGGQIIVGSAGNGNSFIVEDGGTVLAESYGGFFVSGNNSTVIVRGEGSSLTLYGLNVARTGSNATFTIKDGATVTNLYRWSEVDNQSTMTVSGAGSIYNTGSFDLGTAPQSSGGAKLIISDGGRIAVFRTDPDVLPAQSLNGRIGYRSTGAISTNNSVLVTGQDSAWTNEGIIYIARENMLTIESGGLVSLAEGTGTLSFVSDDHRGGTLNIGAFDLAAPTTAGTLQAGSIVFDAGAHVINFNQTDATTLGADISGGGSLVQRGSGTTTLTGAATHTGGTTISAGTLAIGDGATNGSVSGDILNNASLVFNPAGALTHGGAISGTGQLTKQGAGTLTLTAPSTYTGGTTVSGGTLLVSDVGPGQSVLGLGHVIVATGGALGGNGSHDAAIVHGTLSPGEPNSVGLMRFGVEALLTPTATTEMQLGGLDPADYDRIIASDYITKGILSISFVNGFTPEIGDTFHLFDGFHSEGAFSDIIFANAGYEADFDYAEGNLVFTAVAPSLPGDYNDDGAIDAADYVVWRKLEGTENVLPNDPIGGTIDTDQYNQWRGNFARTAPGGGATTFVAVPEPVGTPLAAVAMLLTWCFAGRPCRISLTSPHRACRL